MDNPTVDIAAGVATVSIRWETADGFHRETREPGADLSDLPADLRKAIATHWNADTVAAHAATLAALAAEEATAPAVPALTPRQLRLMMLQIGLTEADVAAAIEALPDPAERAAAMIEWTWATRIERDHPLVVLLAATLDFEPGQLDALWNYAAQL